MRNLKEWVRSQLPNFVKEGEYEKFIAFLEAYYEFLETKNEVHDRLFRFNDFNDVDTTLDEFIHDLARSFSFAIPPRFYQSKRDALKHFKEMHSIKGTPNSYKLLFRFLFDEAIDIYYPETDILRSSAQRWSREITIIFSHPDGFSLQGKTVKTDNLSFEVIFVEALDSINNIYRATIDGGTLVGEVGNEQLIWEVGVSGIFGTVIKSFGFASVISGGTEFWKGQFINIHSLFGKVTLQVTDVDSDGAIKGLNILSQTFISSNEDQSTRMFDVEWREVGETVLTGSVEGILFQSYDFMNLDPLESYEWRVKATLGSDWSAWTEVTTLLDPFEMISAVNSTTGSPATVLLRQSILGEKKTSFAESFHQPSGRSRLQDGVFYSPYTVVIKTGNDISRWKDILLNMLHPAGIGLFSQLLIQSTYYAEFTVDSSIQNPSQQTVKVYNWYVLNGILYALRYFMSAKKSIISITYHTRLSVNTFHYIEQNKFLCPPYEEGVAGTANVHRKDSTLEYDFPDPLVINEVPLYGVNDYWEHQNFNIDTLGDTEIGYVISAEKNVSVLQPGSFILVKFS